MALAFRQGTTGTSSGSTNPTVSTAFASSAVVGNLIVVSIADDSGVANNITSVTDTGGNTYSRITAASGQGTSCLNMYYAVVTTGGASFTVSVTWNVANTTGISFAAQEFNGFTGTPTLDKSTKAGPTSSTSASSGASAATTQANELVISGVEHSGTTSAFSLGTGYTNLSTQNIANHAVAQESKVVSSTGAQTGAFTIAASREWICGVATFYDLVSSGLSVSVSDTVTTSEGKTVTLFPPDLGVVVAPGIQQVANVVIS